MGYLAAYNTSTVSGSLEGGTINVAISSSIFSGSTGAIRFGDVLQPPSGGMTIIGDSNTQLGVASASATPLFWSINNLTDTASVLNTINALPERITQTRFVTTSSAYLYLVSSSKYFPILGTEPLNIPVTDGLVMYLNAGQLISYPTTASKWYDISGYNNSGSLLNGPTYNPIGSIVFDGIDDNVNIESYISMSNPTTVCALINRSLATASNQVFFGPQANGQDNWLAINFNVLQLFGTQTSDVNNFSITGNTFISSSRWYFVTGMINGPTASIYLNGNLERSTTQSFNIGGWGGPARIGSRGTTQFPFPGQISNIQAYNKALSQAEINQNYYQAPIVTDGLVTALDAGNLVSYQSGSTILYSLTGSLSGSLTNGTGYSNRNGGSWVFDGIDDYILTQPNSGINSIYTNNQLTIQSWINYQDSGSFRNVMGILRNSDPTFLSFGWRVPPSNIVFFDSVISGSRFTQNVMDLNSYIGKYINIATTYTNGSVLSYANGVLVASNVVTGQIADFTSNSFFLGNQAGYGYFKGNIAPTYLYNRALTATEIAQNFNAQRNRFGF
jgi:hypothetical protein